MKFKLYKYKSLTSTNDQAISFIKNENDESGYIHSDNQTCGRGTHGKKWISTKDNLFGSIFFPLKDIYPSFHEFSFINPILIFDVIKSFCGSCDLSLKWPNDILINGKKICGILQETIKKKDKSYLIIGIGINLFSNPKINGIKVGNIFDETNVSIKKNFIIKEIVNSYEKFFTEIAVYKFEDYKNKTNSLSIWVNNLEWN